MSYWKKIVEFLIGGSGDRARDSKGRFVPDDKSTTDRNEAYKDGKKSKRECLKCGPGVFLAEHNNRFACGKCGFMEKK